MTKQFEGTYKMLERSDTVKKLEPKTTTRVQPKIGGKNHSEVISTELLKKSTQDLMEASFNNVGLEMIHSMERYDDLNKTTSDITGEDNSNQSIPYPQSSSMSRMYARTHKRQSVKHNTKSDLELTSSSNGEERVSERVAANKYKPNSKAFEMNAQKLDRPKQKGFHSPPKKRKQNDNQ